MSDPSAVPADVLEHVAYLSRSANRVRILETLAAEPHSRRDLQETTAVSRPTLGRILTELDERDWVERTTDGDYAATPQGKHVVAEFRPLIEAMAAIDEFGETVSWLPTDELPISLQHFSDATVRRPAPNEPSEAGRYLADALRDASTFYSLTFIAPPRAVGLAIENNFLTGQFTAEHVFSGELVDYLRDHPERPPSWREHIEAGARIYRYDGRVPSNLFIVDELVLLLKSQPEKGTVGTAIESRNETVRSWAVDLIETYRVDADRVAVETFDQRAD